MYEFEIQPSKKLERYYYIIKKDGQIIYDSKNTKSNHGTGRSYSYFNAYMRAQIIIRNMKGKK
jgi:hypothetical protein